MMQKYSVFFLSSFLRIYIFWTQYTFLCVLLEIFKRILKILEERVYGKMLVYFYQTFQKYGKIHYFFVIWNSHEKLAWEIGMRNWEDASLFYQTFQNMVKFIISFVIWNSLRNSTGNKMISARWLKCWHVSDRDLYRKMAFFFFFFLQKFQKFFSVSICVLSGELRLWEIFKMHNLEWKAKLSFFQKPLYVMQNYMILW